MELPNKAIVTIVLASAILGGYIERQFAGKTTIHDTITKDNDIVTIIKEKQNKDGTSEKDTTIVDKSKEKEKIVEIIAPKPPEWLVQGQVGLIQGLTTVYTLNINKRLLGPIFVGAWGSTQQSVGVSVGILF